MNIHIFDLDWTLCEELWVLSDNMINNLIELSKKDKIYINTWRSVQSFKKAVKNNTFLLDNLTLITENWSKCGKRIYNFNKNEVQEIINFLEKNLKKIKYFDFWVGDKLYTYSLSRIIDEDENRIYYDNFLDIKDCIYNNLHSISMFYIVFYEYLQYTFKEVCWVFWDCDLTLTRRGINKAKILESLKSYSRIFVYWNWVNDLSLFYNKKRRKFNIWVWNNQEILQLSDVKLKSYVELEEYLMSKVFMDL